MCAHNAVVKVSVSACFGGKGKLHFTPDNANVNDEVSAEILSCSTKHNRVMLISFDIFQHERTLTIMCPVENMSSASEMTCIVSGVALKATHSLSENMWKNSIVLL